MHGDVKMWLVDGDNAKPVMVDDSDDGDGRGAFDETTGIYFTAQECDLFATEEEAMAEINKRAARGVG